MTSNQINYLSLKENKRHNSVVETETGRHNIASEELIKQQNEETVRHNQFMEQNALFQAETQRQQVLELQRSNMANESIKRDQLDETRRHNFGTENLQLRSLVEQERNNLVNNQIGLKNASAALLGANAQMFNAQELARHNSELEAETWRHNLRNEYLTINTQNETNRHNIAMENNDLFRNVTGAGNTSTANITQQSSVSEAGRHNAATEKHNRNALIQDTVIDLLTLWERRTSNKERNKGNLSGIESLFDFGGTP